LTYTHFPGHSGSTFEYKVNDVQTDSYTATIKIKIIVPNRAPVANDQTLSTMENTPLTITLTASDPDGDPRTYTVLTQPEHGALTGTAPNLVYTPETGYLGPDSFTFKANDGKVDSNIATISITVKEFASITLRVTGSSGDLFNVVDYAVPAGTITEDGLTLNRLTPL
jgi:hypothetical protein